MKDQSKTKKTLIRELDAQKMRIAELEKLESDHKQVEEALRVSEEKYRNLFQNANEAIFVAQDGKLVFLNPMSVKLIGYSGEEVMSRSFIEFIHPDDRDMVIDRHIRRMKGEEIPTSILFGLFIETVTSSGWN
jgi:PAS domain-containing protein